MGSELVPKAAGSQHANWVPFLFLFNFLDTACIRDRFASYLELFDRHVVYGRRRDRLWNR